MKIKLLVLSLSILLLTGCQNQAEQEVRSSNSAFDVEKLFETDGCKVYRFQDGFNYHYFANCSGSISSKYSCGKNCTREEIITTNNNCELKEDGTLGCYKSSNNNENE